MSKVLILGSTGQLGRALSVLLGGNAIVVGREEADFSKPESLKAVIERHNPSAIFNAVAYTQVDKAESEEALAFTVNAEAPSVLALAAVKRNIPLVHYSTDYVFPGDGTTPWIEEASVSPLNAYGRSKRAGEEAIMASGGKYLIFRTSWVYDADGKNFLNTMLRLGAERESLSIVADQIGAPTYAPHLAAVSAEALNNAQAQLPFPSGIYHLCNAGETSWHGFAQAIFAEARNKAMPLKVANVMPIPADAYPTPAKRPANSRMSCEKAQRILGVTMPRWEEGLAEAMQIKFSQKAA